MSERVVSQTPARFELRLDGELAGFADYHDSDGVRVFPHTVTEPSFAGQGVASQLVEEALDRTRTEGLAVHPSCSFVAAWIDKHPDYQDLLA